MVKLGIYNTPNFRRFLITKTSGKLHKGVGFYRLLSFNGFKKLESLSTPEQAKEKQKEAAKVEDTGSKRKPPTLYRPGEKPAQTKP